MRRLLIGSIAACCAATAPLTAAAAPTTVVAGVVTGIVSFSGAGIPALPDLCEPVSFTFSGTVQGSAVQAGTTAFAGALGISGSGSSGCEGVPFGSGTLSVSATSYASLAGEASMSCPSLPGVYFRIASHALLEVGGACLIGSTPTNTIGVIVNGEVIPTTPGAGVLGPVTTADLAGALTGEG
jgi:hypothetical protein